MQPWTTEPSFCVLGRHFNRASLNVDEPVGRFKRGFSVATGFSGRQQDPAQVCAPDDSRDPVARPPTAPIRAQR